MKVKTVVFLAIITILFIPVAKGQKTVGQIYVSRVREEVTLTTDRDIYLSGENVWFSATCTIINPTGKKQLSNVLYLELYRNKQAVVKKKFQIVDGMVQGMFIIPEELPPANYYLRAYTQYMRNFPPETFFTSLLTIINPEIPFRKSQTEPVRLVKIVPEGGKILSGLPARIAVRLNPELLKIVEHSLLADQDETVIKEFKPAANGLALIEFTPADSPGYFLKFILNTGDTITEPLPKISHTGIIVSENLKRNEVTIYSGPDILDGNNPNYVLAVYSSNGAKILEKLVTIDKPKQTVTVTADKPGQGIHYILLLNNAGKVAARTTYYQPFAETIKINLSTQQQVFGFRAPVHLKINTGQKNKISISTLNVSVVKKGTEFSFQQALPVSVVDNPLLLNAYTGRITESDSTIESQIKTALILNRNFLGSQNSGQQLFEENHEKIELLPEIRDVSLSGIVRNKKTKQALSGVWVFASVLGPDAQIHAYKTSKDGRFVFSLNKLNNTRDLSLTMDSIPGVEAEFLIYNDFSDKWSSAKDVPLQIDTGQRALLESMYVNYQLAEMFRKKEKITEHYTDSIPFPFNDLEASVRLKDYIALPNMTEVLHELVPYVAVRKRKGKHYLTVNDPVRKVVSDHPLILVDNLPVFNVEEILSINPAKVKRIDVIGKMYSFGDLLIEGIIMIYTKTDDFAGIRLPSNSVFVEYQTISPSASVQFPVYNPRTKESGHSPDFKNLLYWNPDISLQKSDTSITFYTGDEETGYEIIVRGKTADGKQFFGKHDIEVDSPFNQ